MIHTPAIIEILTEMDLRARAADFTEAGVISRPVTVRHARNRGPVRGEKPAVTMLVVSDEPQPTDVGHTMDEVTRELVIDLQVDLDLATEDSGLDPTGLLVLLRVGAVFLAALKDVENATWLGGRVDWISIGSLEPDDRSTSDEGRMTRAITVLYRVPSNDHNFLLWAGANR